MFLLFREVLVWNSNHFFRVSRRTQNLISQCHDYFWNSKKDPTRSLEAKWDILDAVTSRRDSMIADRLCARRKKSSSSKNYHFRKETSFPSSEALTFHAAFLRRKTHNCFFISNSTVNDWSLVSKWIFLPTFPHPFWLLISTKIEWTHKEKLKFRIVWGKKLSKLFFSLD